MQEISLTSSEVANQLDAEADAALVQQAQCSPTAFAALYRRYVTRVYRYLYSRVGQAIEAEDLTAQTFTEALAGLERYREQGNFAAWLFTIARRRASDYYRQQRIALPLDEMLDIPAADSDTPLAQVSHQETRQRLADLVAGLSEGEQELLRLRFAADLTYRQIGQLVGRSEDATKMAIHRLLHKLRAALEVYDD